jgi:WhiB family transcriptional regulator, redox-sensing transcriptional regulator
LKPNSIGSLQAAEPEPGIRGLSDLKLHPQAIRSSKEVKDMTITVLDRRDGSADALLTPATLGELHDRADTVPDELLPCRVNDSELWFAESPADVEYAKALCQDCPVRDLCLSGALERREPWGVWGGELFLQGVVIPRKRPRGRPRKNEQAA